MSTSRLSLKISAPIVVVAALALGLTVFLNVGKIERTLSEVEESRLRFTLNELRANLETGLDLGLTVKGLGNAEAALEQQVRQDPDILSISVVDTGGALVFNSGKSAATQIAIPKSKGRDWMLREAGVLTLGTRLSNNFGAHAGAVVLRYSVREHDAVVDRIARELVLAAVCAVVATALCLIFGIHALVRRMDRTLGAMESALDSGQYGGDIDRHAAALVEQVNRTSTTALHDLAGARATLTPPEAPQ